MSQEKYALETKIKDVDEQIIFLTNLKSQYLSKLNSLQTAAVSPVISEARNDRTFDQKIALFKSYFRGREDVYSKPVPRSWVFILCLKMNIVVF